MATYDWHEIRSPNCRSQALDVEIEPNLLSITGETLHHSANQQPDARLDISIRGFWQRGERAFADVRIFNGAPQGESVMA